MSETIGNLWPKEFKIDVQSPLAILRVQARLLSTVTRGILEGAVETEKGKEAIQHRLVVIAPAYKNYRHTLLVAVHDLNLPYPAEVRAEALQKRVKEEDHLMATINMYKTVYPKANDDFEMQTYVQQTLQSNSTKAAILSLIAKSNEASQPQGEVPNAEGQ